MSPAAPDTPPAARGNLLTRKVGPLPTWAYVTGFAVAGFFWWRSRSGSPSAASGVTPDATAIDSGTPTTDYGQGFDYGYAAGLNATGDVNTAGDSSGSGPGSGGDGTQGPVSHNRICFKAKDPSGHLRTVCALGSWKKGTGGNWHWIPGIPPAHPGQLPTRTVHSPTIIRHPTAHGASRPLDMVGQSVPYPMQ